VVERYVDGTEAPKPWDMDGAENNWDGRKGNLAEFEIWHGSDCGCLKTNKETTCIDYQ
jgi:hypothetical protein